MEPSSRLFSCRKKLAETGQPDGYISTRYTDKEGDNMCNTSQQNFFFYQIAV